MEDLQHSPALARGFLLPIVTVSSVGIEALRHSSGPMVFGATRYTAMRPWKQF